MCVHGWCVCRVAALHQFIIQRLPPGIYGADGDIDPASRGFKIMSRDDLRAVIDIGYAEVCLRLLRFSVFLAPDEARGWSIEIPAILEGFLSQPTERSEQRRLKGK